MVDKKNLYLFVASLVLCIFTLFLFFQWSYIQIPSLYRLKTLSPVLLRLQHKLLFNKSYRSASLTEEKKFIYLVQGEECLPKYFVQKNLVGNTTECNCDVIMLSFKKKCDQKISYQHIQHVYRPKTTWTSGRNELYRLARNRSMNYHYYIFADDDFQLQFTNSSVNMSVANATRPSVLRTFEKFLLDVEPVLGCMNYPNHHSAKLIRTIRKYCLNKPDLSLLPMVHFDPILNAFHRDAISHLLPYSEEHDNKCWWHSNRILSIDIEIKFRGQAIMFPDTTVTNPLHRGYPRWDNNATEIMKKALLRKRSLLPEKYRDHFSIRSYLESTSDYSEGLSQTTCMEVKRHDAIVPYRHFDEYLPTAFKSMGDVFDIPALQKEIG